jgi:integrase
MLTKTRIRGVYQFKAKDGAITYAVRYYVPDEKAKTGWAQKQATFEKLQQAIDFKITRGADIKRGDYVSPSNHTVKDIAAKYLEVRKPRLKAQTYLSYETHVRKYIVPKLGEIKATSLKSVDVEKAGAEWEKRVDAKTVNKVFATLNRVYKFAKKLEVKNNPMADVERLKSQTKPEDLEALAAGEILDRGEDLPEEKAGKLRAIRPDEVYSAAELKTIIDKSSLGFERAFLMTAIFTGMRHGELNGLRWKGVIDLKKKTLCVNRSLTQLKGGPVLEKPKNKNAYRRLKLSAELAKELTQWKLQSPPNPNDLVFVSELGKPNCRKSNNRMLKAVCKRAGVKALSVNNLRHSFASQNLIAGLPPLKVSHLMGHSDPGVTLKIYSHWAEGEDSKAETLLAERIFNAVAEEATGSEG